MEQQYRLVQVSAAPCFSSLQCSDWPPRVSPENLPPKGASRCHLWMSSLPVPRGPPESTCFVPLGREITGDELPFDFCAGHPEEVSPPSGSPPWLKSLVPCTQSPSAPNAECSLFPKKPALSPSATAHRVLGATSSGGCPCSPLPPPPEAPSCTPPVDASLQMPPLQKPPLQMALLQKSVL